MQNCLRTMEPNSGLLVCVCAMCVDRLNRRLVLVWISIQGYKLFNLSMNEFVPGVKLTSVGMKLQFLWYKTSIKKYEIEQFWYEIASQKYEKLKVWKYTQRYENDVNGMKK